MRIERSLFWLRHTFKTLEETASNKFKVASDKLRATFHAAVGPQRPMLLSQLEAQTAE